jgi:hypothetical protein
MSIDAGKRRLTRGERLQIMLSPDELVAVDDFRFKHRMPSRAAAVRELFRLGLAGAGLVKQDGRRSADFGVFDDVEGQHPNGGGSAV